MAAASAVVVSVAAASLSPLALGETTKRANSFFIYGEQMGIECAKKGIMVIFLTLIAIALIWCALRATSPAPPHIGSHSGMRRGKKGLIAYFRPPVPPPPRLKFGH